MKVKEIVATICLIVTTIISILAYYQNRKIYKIDYEIKKLEYKNLKKKR